MGSLAQSSHLPVINLSTANLKLGSASWTSVSDRVRDSLEEYGCFVAVYDQIPLELQARVFEVLKDLFDLPSETKAQNSSKIPFHGYLGQQAMIPLHQSLGIERSTTSDSLRNFTNLMWPSEKLVDTEHPRRFNTFDHYGLLRFFATPAGLTSPCTATAYCGA